MTYRDERAAWQVLDEIDKMYAGRGRQAYNAPGEGMKNLFRKPGNRVYEVADPEANKRIKLAGHKSFTGLGGRKQWKKERETGGVKRMTGDQVRDQRRRDKEGKFSS